MRCLVSEATQVPCKCCFVLWSMKYSTVCPRSSVLYSTTQYSILQTHGTICMFPCTWESGIYSQLCAYLIYKIISVGPVYCFAVHCLNAMCVWGCGCVCVPTHVCTCFRVVGSHSTISPWNGLTPSSPSPHLPFLLSSPHLPFLLSSPGLLACSPPPPPPFLPPLPCSSSFPSLLFLSFSLQTL